MVPKSLPIADFFPSASWTSGVAECEAARPFALHKRADSTGFRKLRVVTGQGKRTAMPTGAAAVAAGLRRDDFVTHIAAIVGGDTESLASLYDATVAKVHGLVKAIVPNAADAEEVTCDVYTQVWQTAKSFDPSRGCVLGWLLSIARSRALDCLRRQRSKSRVFSDQTPEDHPAALLSLDQDSPEILLDAFQSRSVVRSALEQLSPERRRLICLAFFNDLSHSEIAELTGLPMGTIKSHLRRAMHSLRGLLYASEME